MPLASQFSQVSTRKKLGKMVPVREHRQCLAILLQIARREFACCTSLGECPITHKGVTARFSDSL